MNFLGTTKAECLPKFHKPDISLANIIQRYRQPGQPQYPIQ